MHSLSDEQLMEIFCNNKDDQGQIAFDHLYNRYFQKMLTFFFFTLNNDYEKARDMVQDLFLKVINHHLKFSSERFFKPWLYRIASNMCKNEFRSFSVEKKYIHYAKTSIETSEFTDGKAKAISESIRQLKQEHRALIVLRFKLKLSVKEIAEIFECPEGTIKSRLFYATQELSKIYNQ